MKRKTYTTLGLTLVAASGILCLLAAPGSCQRGGRQARGQSAGRAATQATTGSTTGTQSKCQSSSTSTGTTTTSNGTTTGTTGTTTGTTTTSTGTTGTTTGTSTLSSLARARAASASGSVSAVRTASNQLLVQYAGSTASVQKVYVATLDANGQMIQQKLITQSPVQAALPLTSTARYYGVQVVYAKGTFKNTITAIP